MNPLYPLVALRAAYRCEYCHAPQAIFNCAFEVEHITPQSLDGGDDDANLALACRICNLRKSAHIEAYDPETNAKVLLFHPRLDRWEDHFCLDIIAGRIVGLTPIGRATVSRLEMNSELHVAARHQWIRLGAFS